jgi:uncharacterized protein YyaL (SSP411 family)
MINQKNKEIKDYLSKKYIPESIIVEIHDKQSLDDLKQFAFFAGKEFDVDNTIVYICKNFSCSLPLKTISEIEKLV